MFKKFVFIIVLFIVFPFYVSAEDLYDISYEDANIWFTIDESEWKEDEYYTDPNFLNRKWESDCGFIMSGTYDLYSNLSYDDVDGYRREVFNYKNLFKDDDTVNSLVQKFQSDYPDYNISDWSYKNHTVKYLYLSGSTNNDGVDINYEFYLTINNGYVFAIQYMNSPTINSSTCSNSIEDIVKSSRPIGKVKYLYDFDFLNILIAIVVTLFAYMAYPLIAVEFIGKKYNKEECKKMALWNSIIVWGIFTIVLSLFGEVHKNFGPALLYYFLNCKLWIRKKNDNGKNTKQKSKEDYKEMEKKDFTCDNCGAKVSANATECPNCGEEFEEDEEEFICDNCGATVSESATECPNCGKEFEEDDEFDERDISKIYNSAVTAKMSMNNAEAKVLLNKYIKKTERILKERDSNAYTFNNCVELTIAVKKGLITGTAEDVSYDTSNAYLFLGAISFDEKNYDEALKYLDKSLKFNPCSVTTLFEKAECYKVKGDMNKYFKMNEKIYEYIYNVTDLAHYYRNLGYYYIETKKWDLAKLVYLYSLKYENSNAAYKELAYIAQKTKDESLPDKSKLAKLLRENNIPTFIKKENLNIIKDLYDKLEMAGQTNSNVGKFLKGLMNKNANL